MSDTGKRFSNQNGGLEKLVKLIDRNDPHISGYACAVLSPDGTHDTHCLGVDAPFEGSAISPETRFHTASIAKPFTAYLIHKLAVSGKIDLDAPASRYIGSQWDDLEDVTIRHLLDHRSGLHDLWPYSYLAGHRSGDVVSGDQLRRIMRSVTQRNFAAGSRYNYCNTGYLILADIVSEVFGDNCVDVARREIFEPVGMEDTEVLSDWRRRDSPSATAWRIDENGERLENTARYAVPGPTSLITSTIDLVKWSKYLANTADPVFQSMLSNAPSYEYFFGLSYANGLFRFSDQDGFHIVGHSGMDWGFNASWALDLKSGAAAVALSCDTNPLAEQAAIRHFFKANRAEPSPSKLGRKMAGPLNLDEGQCILFSEQSRHLHVMARGSQLFLPTNGALLDFDPESGAYQLPGHAGFIAIDEDREEWRCAVQTPFDLFEGIASEISYAKFTCHPQLPTSMCIDRTNLAVRILEQTDTSLSLCLGDMERVEFVRRTSMTYTGPGFDLIVEPDKHSPYAAYLSQPRSLNIGLRKP